MQCTKDIETFKKKTSTRNNMKHFSQVLWVWRPADMIYLYI